MKNFIIFCLFLGLLSSIKCNQDLHKDVDIMNFALDTSGRAYQAERHMLLDCRAHK